MRDADIRAAVLRTLHDRFDADGETRIVEEMGVWSGSVRIDVAVINGELHGFELKSARDTLERLRGQATLYNQVFDRVTLVTAERHIPSASKDIPNWWGVTVAYSDAAGATALREIIAPSCNPNIEPLQLARLLWRDEALALLTRYGIDRGVRSGTVEAIAARLAERLPLHTLGLEVRTTLKTRAGWLGQPIRHER